MLRIFQVCVVAAMLIVSSQANAQSCGCSAAGEVNNCGKEITQVEAAGLWADYCTESCMGHHHNRCGLGLFQRHRGCGLNLGQRGCGLGRGGCGNDCGVVGDCGCEAVAEAESSDCGCEAPASDCGCEASGSDCGCGIGGLLGQLRGRLGSRSHGCGCTCDTGCFDYPSSCGDCGSDACGCGLLSNRGSCLSRVGGLLNRGGGCGCVGGKLRGLFARLGNVGCGNSCGCGNGFSLRGLFSGRLFSRSAACCGEPCSYFNEAVGYEYGNAGMQSCVSGCGGCAPVTDMDIADTPMEDEAKPAKKKKKKQAKKKAKKKAEDN